MQTLKKREPNSIDMIEKMYGKGIADLVVKGLVNKALKDLRDRK